MLNGENLDHCDIADMMNWIEEALGVMIELNHVIRKANDNLEIESWEPTMDNVNRLIKQIII